MGRLRSTARALVYAAILATQTGAAAAGATDARTLERSDWLAHLPLALAVVSFVVVVDTIVFSRIIRARRRAGR